MWVLKRIRESMESIPLEVSRYLAWSEDGVSSHAGLSSSLHSNVLTPDTIPEFCLPPRLCRRDLPTIPLPLHTRNLPTKTSNGTCAKQTHAKTKETKTRTRDVPVFRKSAKKPLPFSADSYGLDGMYESPNTRRKESLFHSKLPSYVLDKRCVPVATTKESNPSKKSLIFPKFHCKSLSESGSTGSETPSSSDSSPLSSPYSQSPSGSGCLKGATSCPVLTAQTGGSVRGFLGVQTSTSSLPCSVGQSLTLAPPVLFPLDVLQCQERLQREHVLPLLGRGKVRLSAESTTFSSNAFSSLSTVRVRVVSVEGLQNNVGRKTLNCAISVCLTPGKLQQQKSATIRNTSSSLVFNEDFFFTELSRQDLQELQLRVKVMDKAPAAALRRGTVIGVITKPLCELLHLNTWVQE